MYDFMYDTFIKLLRVSISLSKHFLPSTTYRYKDHTLEAFFCLVLKMKKQNAWCNVLENFVFIWFYVLWRSYKLCGGLRCVGGKRIKTLFSVQLLLLLFILFYLQINYILKTFKPFCLHFIEQNLIFMEV